MGMLVIHHKVKDFAAWKPLYDKHEGIRTAAGLTKAHVLQSVDDPNDVTVVMDFSDATKAKAFSASPNLKEVMKTAGVLGTPAIHILKKVT
jgi:quinol monooxygenase YgiN